MDPRRASVRSTASQFYEPDTPYDEENPNVFDDEYAESYAGSVREPRAARSDEAFLSPFGDDAALESGDVGSRPPSPRLQQLQPRSSILKASRRSLQKASAEPPTALYRPATNVSGISIAPSEAQFDEETGPSHPYGMYTQGLGISRSNSIATTSTMRTSDHPGPAHPYTMYPQDVSSDGTVSEPSSSIPIGFAGLEPPHHRRVRAGGEEEDIIGSDGHVEQLPPYTRFDENGGKIVGSVLAPSSAGPFAEGAAPQSMTDASDLTRSIPQPGNHREPLSIESPQRSWREMSWSEWWHMSWREKRKKRFCGVSFGIILIGIAAVAVVIVVCVAVIGGFMEKQRHHGKNLNQAQQPPPPPSVVTTTQLIDASPVASSTGSSMPVLPTGSYEISLFANVSKQSCLAATPQLAAWACSPQGQLYLNVVGNTISVGNSSSNATVAFGAQPMVLGLQTLQLVTDTTSPVFGDAYHFQTWYDKVVIVEETSLSKRDTGLEPRQASNGIYRQSVQPGQQPWFCYWNHTFVEGFIYVQQTNSTELSSITSSGAAISTMTSAMSSSAVAKRWASAPASPPCSSQTWARNNVAPSSPSASSTLATSTAPPMPTTTTGYPRLIRFREARINNQQPQGYCEKMQLLYDGTFSPVRDGSGSIITIQLNETDPTIAISRRGNVDGLLVERASQGVRDGCFCQLQTP